MVRARCGDATIAAASFAIDSRSLFGEASRENRGLREREIVRDSGFRQNVAAAAQKKSHGDPISL
jgi:hypothetical protein